MTIYHSGRRNKVLFTCQTSDGEVCFEFTSRISHSQFCCRSHAASLDAHVMCPYTELSFPFMLDVLTCKVAIVSDCRYGAVIRPLRRRRVVSLYRCRFCVQSTSTLSICLSRLTACTLSNSV